MATKYIPFPIKDITYKEFEILATKVICSKLISFSEEYDIVISTDCIGYNLIPGKYILNPNCLDSLGNYIYDQLSGSFWYYTTQELHDLWKELQDIFFFEREWKYSPEVQKILREIVYILSKSYDFKKSAATNFEIGFKGENTLPVFKYK